ncbi:hypothetical protein GJ496_003182 [Pomphorhynchus laevis]|nr:hypothetical protein GJ496_003182 [Pomphorhynchus laevis]
MNQAFTCKTEYERSKLMCEPYKYELYGSALQQLQIEISKNIFLCRKSMYKDPISIQLENLPNFVRILPVFEIARSASAYMRLSRSRRSHAVRDNTNDLSRQMGNQTNIST